MNNQGYKQTGSSGKEFYSVCGVQFTSKYFSYLHDTY